jgi:hypothetical protein
MAGFKVTTEVKAKAGDQVVFVELWDRGSGIGIACAETENTPNCR